MSAFNLSFSISPSLSYFLPHGCSTYLGKVSSGLMIKLVMARAGGKRYTAVLTNTRGKKMKQNKYENNHNQTIFTYWSLQSLSYFLMLLQVATFPMLIMTQRPNTIAAKPMMTGISMNRVQFKLQKDKHCLKSNFYYQSHTNSYESSNYHINYIVLAKSKHLKISYMSPQIRI